MKKNDLDILMLELEYRESLYGNYEVILSDFDDVSESDVIRKYSLATDLYNIDCGYRVYFFVDSRNNKKEPSVEMQIEDNGKRHLVETINDIQTNIHHYLSEHLIQKNPINNSLLKCLNQLSVNLDSKKMLDDYFRLINVGDKNYTYRVNGKYYTVPFENKSHIPIDHVLKLIGGNKDNSSDCWHCYKTDSVEPTDGGMVLMATYYDGWNYDTGYYVKKDKMVIVPFKGDTSKIPISDIEYWMEFEEPEIKID